MRPCTDLATLLFALSFVGASTPARAQATDACTVYLCMASISGQGSPPANCTAAILQWHLPQFIGGLAIYNWHPWKFLPKPSYNNRKQYINSCSGATDTANNGSISDSIMNQWGDKE